MNTHTHTTIAGDVFLPSTIITNPRIDANRRRPPEPPSPLGIWILIALASALASLTTYLLLS